jgi:2-hydroxycyclohexanecarboxyl-CoA dehydrogenase
VNNAGRDTPEPFLAVTRAMPLGRDGRPEDVAGAVVYLASPAADHVTGQTLSVSAGLTMV